MSMPFARKGRKFPLYSQTQDGRRMQIQRGSDTPAARSTLQPRQSMRSPGAYSSYAVENGAGDATAHVEAVPQVTAGPLTVTQGALLSIRLPRQRGLHGFTHVEGGFHQGIPERQRKCCFQAVPCHAAARQPQEMSSKQQPASASTLTSSRAEM